MVKTKIEIVGYSKESLEEFYNRSEFIREIFFQEDEDFLEFNNEIHGMINQILERDPTPDQKIFFKNYCLKNRKYFLLVDPLNRKFGI